MLGPCPFSVYVNDLSDRVMSLTRLFADDTSLYQLIISADDCKTLQDGLQRPEQWESDWDMDFRVDKCSVLPVTKSKSPVSCNLQKDLADSRMANPVNPLLSHDTS